MRRAGLGLVVLLAAACGSSGGGGDSGGGGSPAGGSGVLAGAGGGAGFHPTAGAGGASPGGGGGTAGASGPVRDWSQIEALLQSAAGDAGVSALGLVIWDATDQRLYERMRGGFTADTRVAVASASKMVSGLVLFDAVRRGELTLDSTTGQVLGWTTNAAITLRQLLSFTSGLPPEAPCTLNPLTTTAACADNVAGASAIAAPGTRFDYGSTHLHVAARMAEVASGKRWPQLFADTLRTPLGLPADVVYYTFPKQSTGMLNPLIAGGLRASINEYAQFLALAFHSGRYKGLTIGTPELFAAQAREPYPTAEIGGSPIARLGLPYHYGLTAWLMCGPAASTTGCAELSSPGAFGFTPWFDRDAGYYAILGMELASGEVEDGVVDFAVKLQQQLAPLIRAQL